MAEYPSVEALRELYRAEAQCQIIATAICRGGWPTPFLVLLDGRVAGYGAVRNRIDQGRLTEFYLLPYARAEAPVMFREITARQRHQGNFRTNQYAVVIDVALRLRVRTLRPRNPV